MEHAIDTHAIERIPSRTLPLGVLGDARLARLAARGDEAAFAQIFRRYHQPLYRYCRAITANGEDASDALQNTMVKAMRSLPGERRTIELKPWLFRVAHNEAVSLLRRRRPQSILSEQSGVAVEGPEAGAAAREDLRELMSDLGDLPDRQQAAVILRELNGLSYAEIGAIFATSTAAAKQAAYDGRVALKDYAKGRAMDCEAVTRAISDGDHGFLRGRALRGHLRACAECSDFKRALETRSASLAQIAPPLPATAAAALLQSLFGAGGGGSAGGGSIVASALGGKLLAGAGAIKGTAVVAAVVVGTGAGLGGARIAAKEDAPSQPAETRTGDAGERNSSHAPSDLRAPLGANAGPQTAREGAAAGVGDSADGRAVGERVGEAARPEGAARPSLIPPLTRAHQVIGGRRPTELQRRPAVPERRTGADRAPASAPQAPVNPTRPEAVATPPREPAPRESAPAFERGPRLP